MREISDGLGWVVLLPLGEGWQNGMMLDKLVLVFVLVFVLECALMRLRERKRVRKYKQSDRYLIQILGAVFECV
jgi:hypothetical protein